MTTDSWGEVDQYIETLFGLSDPVLEAALRASAEAELPPIQVTPPQGMLLSILTRSIRARSILEIGLLGGYSTIWLGRALAQGGKLISLEVNPKHAAVGRENLRRAGLNEVVEVLIGPALETLPQLAAEGRGPFDLIFIDADKPNTADYFEWAVKLSHPGSLIITDNVVRKGAVADPSSTDPNVLGVRRFNAVLAAERRVTATVIQTVSSKGYDGFAIALVN